MTTAERVQAVAEFGFTERQARFLVLVMRHAGVCVPRQYAHFAGVAYGAKCNAFFNKLVRRGYAAATDCIHNRARLYHVHHKPLYQVIGEATSRYRRQLSPRIAIERLMLLDAVLMMPKLEWLTTTTEKAAHRAKLETMTNGEAPEAMPANAATRRSGFPSTFPIGLESDGRTVLFYLATEPWTDGFRSFLQRHSALLRPAPSWTLRLVFPRPLDRLYDAYQTVIREEFECPLQPATLSGLRRYFEHRRQAADGPLPPQTREFLDDAKAFGTPRFTEMYQRWLKQGENGVRRPVFAGHCGCAEYGSRARRVPRSPALVSPSLSLGRPVAFHAAWS